MLSARVTVIWHDYSVKIDDVPINGKALWNDPDEMQQPISLLTLIHLIAIYHRVEATTENDPAVQYYPNVVIPTWHQTMNK